MPLLLELKIREWAKYSQMSTVFVSFWKRDNCLPDFKGTERFTIGNFTIPIVKRSF